jgi:hypothetical protein
MKYRFGFTLPLCLLFAGLTLTPASAAAAQDQSSDVTPPPPVLEVIVEYVKPGQNGVPHEKTESVFAQAMRDAKWPTPYIGMNALTGKSHAVFYIGYNSFADWEKDNAAMAKDATLSAVLDNANQADGALLQSTQTNVLTYRPDLSLRPGADVGRTRFFQVTMFHVRSGHMADFEALAKLYISAYQNVPNTHWDTFTEMYGADGNDSVLVVTPMKSMTEIDQQMADDAKLPTTLSEDQRKQMRDLTAASIESSWSALNAVNPKMSYASDKWSKEDPGFWNQR